MGISDTIASFILSMLEDTGGCAELQRADVAQQFGCVPSQINYVIHTRFSPEHGYLVESRRGGGGYIRITRVAVDRECMLMHTVNAIGETIDSRCALALLSNLLEAEIINLCCAKMIAAATGDPALRALPPEERDRARASIFKQMLLHASCRETPEG